MSSTRGLYQGEYGYVLKKQTKKIAQNYGYLVKTFKPNLVKILNFNKVFKVNDVMFFQKNTANDDLH